METLQLGVFPSHDLVSSCVKQTALMGWLDENTEAPENSGDKLKNYICALVQSVLVT